MPDREEEPPVFRWNTLIARGAPVARDALGGKGKPQFGVPPTGRWIVMVAVVSASVGVFVFLGAFIGLLVARPLGPRVGLGWMVGIAASGGVLGVLIGTKLAFRLTDIDPTRPRLVASTAGGIAGLALGSAIPVYLGLGFASLAPMLAIAGPGVGAVAGLVAAGRWTAWRAKRSSVI